jgi:hypothetical protein
MWAREIAVWPGARTYPRYARQLWLAPLLLCDSVPGLRWKRTRLLLLLMMSAMPMLPLLPMVPMLPMTLWMLVKLHGDGMHSRRLLVSLR